MVNAKSMIQKLYPMNIKERYPMKLCSQRRKLITSNYGYFGVIGIQNDDTLAFSGATPSPPMPTVKNMYSIAHSKSYSAILDNKGVCTYTGKNNGTWSNIIDIEIAYDSYGIVGLKPNGTCVSVGFSVSGWNNIVDVSARGARFAVGLKSDGTCVSTSSSYNLSSWKNIVAICTGIDFAVGLKSDGTCVSTSSLYNLSSWKNIVAISAGSDDGIIGLKSDGTCVSVGSYTVSNWKDIVIILSCNDVAIGVKADGTCISTRYGVSSWRLPKYEATTKKRLLFQTEFKGFIIFCMQFVVLSW